MIDLNGIPAYQAKSKDILLVQKVDKGKNCINWDGKDGTGALVDRCGGLKKIYVTFVGGLTHLSIYDVETNQSGIVVEWVRPIRDNKFPSLYWDDRNFLYHTIPPSEGCNGSEGCHGFGWFGGDSSTMNSWWYIDTEFIDTIEFYNARAVIADAIVKNQSCSNKSDGSIELIGEGLFDPFSYSIGARSYQDMPVFDNLFAGEYTVKIIDQRECIQTKKFIVGLNTTIQSDFEVENIGKYNDFEFTFTGEGSNLYHWNFADGVTSKTENPFHHFSEDGVYDVKLISGSGYPDFCLDSIVKTVEVHTPLELYAPTAFSPNGDNLNDTFQLIGYGLYSYDLYIFSSNGKQLFTSNNLEFSWDGTYNSEPCLPGVYAYVVHATDKYGSSHQKKGTFTLVR